MPDADIRTTEDSMNTKELAAALTGMEYPPRLPKELTKAAKSAGLVILHGASDDLMEFAGAIDDELGAGNGKEVWVDAQGLLPDRESLDDDDELRALFKREDAKPSKITVNWDKDGYSWTYTTAIPHETFEIVEDGEKYCRGIVFALADAKS
jgi:hypothetical protein